jgi:acyl-CoA reductase-like NAD-dependent aldehyde dehydrogenase
MRDYTRAYIDGAWVAPAGGEVLDVINPATEQSAGQITLATLADVDRAVTAARKAFRTFSRTMRQERIDLLKSILDSYAARQWRDRARVRRRAAQARAAKIYLGARDTTSLQGLLAGSAKLVSLAA